MPLLSRFSHLFPVSAAAPAPVVEVEPTPQHQRRVALRCLGCNSWNRSRLVYMSNGGDYCLDCARQISRRYGYSVAGKRWTDITSLDRAADCNAPPLRSSAGRPKIEREDEP